MARTNALIKSSTWDAESDFRGLDKDPQRLYVLILAQPQMSNCGVVPYAPERWARTAADETRDGVERAIADLEAARYVLVDRDTEELLVRTFIRHDGIAEQPNLWKAARREITQIESVELRRFLRDTYPEVFHPDALPPSKGLPARLPRGVPAPATEGVPEGVTEPLREGVPKGVNEPLSPRARRDARARTPCPTPLAPAPNPDPRRGSSTDTPTPPRATSIDTAGMDDLHGIGDELASRLAGSNGGGYGTIDRIVATIPGIRRDVLEPLVNELPPNIVETCLEDTIAKHTAGELHRGPGAYLVGALRLAAIRHARRPATDEPAL